MTDKKKKYLAPEIEMVEIEAAEIICASTGYNEGPLNINGGEGITFGEEDW